VSYKYPSNNEVTFKIIVGCVINQMVILKTTLLFDGHLIDISIIRRITRREKTSVRKE